MPLGVTLLDLRRELRSETGTSLNPGQGVAAQGTLDLLLARQQRELWDAYTWQHLVYYFDIPLAAEQETYDYPPAMAFDQITRMYVAESPDFNWKPLAYGIRAHMYKSGVGAGNRVPQYGTPVRWANWPYVDTSGPVPITHPLSNGFYLMPVPNTDSMVLRLEGQAPLSPLIADTDTCIIDSKAIVLFAAAEILANQKSEAAPMKLTKAQNYLRRLLADQGADKRSNYNMGGVYRGGIDPDRRGSARAYIDYIP